MKLLGLIAALALAAFFLGRDARGPSGRISGDGWYYQCYLVSLLGDGDLDFTDEYQETGNWYRFTETRAGMPANPFGIGPAIFELPFYALGAVVARVAGDEGGGFSPLRGKVTMLASPLFSVAALFFAVRMLRRRLPGGDRLAWGAALAIWASGPIVYYAVRQPGYAHPFATFFASWFLDAWDAARDRPRTLRTWLALGALLGASALARPQLVLWGVVLLGIAWADRRRPLHLLAGAVAALAVFSPQLLAWQAIYGSPLVVPQGAGFMVWGAPRWSEVLFAARNGLFAWAPLWAVALVGLVAAGRRAAPLLGPRRALRAPWREAQGGSRSAPRFTLLAGVLLQVWANGAVWDWWAGGSYGGRRFDSCLLPFALGLGWLLSRRRALALPVALVTALCVAGNLWLAARSEVFNLDKMQGRPVVALLRERVPAGLADFVGGLSWVVTLPARAAFALRHDAPLGAYDRIVGVHVLTEQFPGTGGLAHPTQMLRPTGAEPWLLGFGGPRPRVLLSLNRRAPVRVTVRASAPVELFWNGVRVADGQTLSPVERGVGDLDLVMPPGTVIGTIALAE